jgi:hypothetical protein
MTGPSRAARIAAALLGLFGAIGLAACDERPQTSERPQKGERTLGEKPPPDAGPKRTEKAEAGPPKQVKPGARPETQPPAAAANLVGTWRVRLEEPVGGPEGVVYTFTADGRVTVGPGQHCRYRLQGQELAIDCTGTSAESATGQLERQGADNLLWKVGDKTVRLERQTGVKEQQ